MSWWPASPTSSKCQYLINFQIHDSHLHISSLSAATRVMVEDEDKYSRMLSCSDFPDNFVGGVG